MLSFWEKNSFLTYDYIIIGSGLVGLSTAAYLKEQQPNCSVLVLERGLFPSGASTKNAGFACFGSLTELLSDLKVMPEDKMVELVENRWKGLLKLRKRLGDNGIGLLPYGGYELLNEQLVDCIEHIDHINDLIRPVFDEKVFELQDEKIGSFGFGKSAVKHLIYNQYEGQIDTGKMMRSLIAYVQSLGVMLLNNCEVLEIEEHATHVAVHTAQSDIRFQAQKLAVCTNAFSKKLLPHLHLKPGRGQVLVTKPIENLKFKGVFHMNEGYDYFRNFGNRVIFGGGRDLDFEAETTIEFGTTTKVQESLIQKLEEIILPNQAFEIEHTWSGIMAFGDTKQPIIEAYSDRIEIGVRLGGMGVAIGSNVGELLATRLLEE